MSRYPLQLTVLVACLTGVHGVQASQIVAESRPLYTTVDDPALHETTPGDGFDSVVKLTLGRSDGIFNCTGNLNDTGLGNEEVMSAQGDSGGPSFINNQIAGVTSYGLRLTNFLGRTSDIDSELNSSFGEFAIDTRVSYYADWIDANLSTPPPFIAGDLNGDGFVGIDDLNLVLNRWNQNVSLPVPLAGDPSGDGFVGIDDLNVVLSDWNQGTPPAGRAAVPEPASIILICTSLGYSVCCRRRSVLR